MATVRIIETDRKTTTSGRAKVGKWTIEFDQTRAPKADPLTGWNGSGDTTNQVRLGFVDLESAKAYCKKNGLDYTVVPAPPVKLKLQAYADNFR